jgi:hypothetical protein
VAQGFHGQCPVLLSAAADHHRLRRRLQGHPGKEDLSPRTSRHLLLRGSGADDSGNQIRRDYRFSPDRRGYSLDKTASPQTRHLLRRTPHRGVLQDPGQRLCRRYILAHIQAQAAGGLFPGAARSLAVLEPKAAARKSALESGCSGSAHEERDLEQGIDAGVLDAQFQQAVEARYGTGIRDGMDPGDLQTPPALPQGVSESGAVAPALDHCMTLMRCKRESHFSV